MKLGQYEIIERIAQGGMAEVYRGRAVGEEGFEKPVAIKRILPHHVSDVRFISMLVQEAGIHASLSHRNIVQIHDLGQSEEGEYFIVLEFVDGRDLDALLEVVSKAAPPGNRIGDALSLYIAIELGEGVHFSHELLSPDGSPSGLVHRDISPSNVLVSYAGEVKLSDFGLAKRQSDHSVVGSLKGKLAYMAPEQAKRWPLDRRSDIFSLGAVLFELLTGKRLRPIADEAEGFRLVASGVMATPKSARPDIPAVLEDLLLRALAPNPQDRFADAAAFVKAARAALDQVPRAKVGEAAELQLLLRSFIPPGVPRPRTEPSRVIRLASEFLPRGKALALTPAFPLTHDGLLRRHSTLQGAPPVPQVPLLAVPAEAARKPGPLAVDIPLQPSPPERSLDDDDTGRLPGAVGHALAGRDDKKRIPTGKTRREPIPTRVPADDLVPVSGELGVPATRSQKPTDRAPLVAPLPGLLKLKRLGNGADAAPAPMRKPTPPPPVPTAALEARKPTPPPPLRPDPAPPARRPTTPPPPPAADDMHARRRRPSIPLPGMPDPHGAEPLPPRPAPEESFEVRLEPVHSTAAPADAAGYSATPVLPMPGLDPAYATPRLAPSPSGVVLTNSGGGAARAIFFFVLLLAGAAAGAHFYFVPLPVLATWWQPATLRVDSVPAGSAVTIDGVALTGQTPIETVVRRDRDTHVIEVRSDGFESQRRMVRYDRAEILSESVILQPDVKRTVEQLPSDPLGQPPIDAGMTDAGTADAGTAPALASGDEAAAVDGTAASARLDARGSEKNSGKRRASQSRPQEGRSRKIRKPARR